MRRYNGTDHGVLQLHSFVVSRALVLAAGRGERMRPLSDSTPKPLLKLGGKALIEHHIHALRRAGIREIVVNLAWQGHRLREHLGDGAAFGVRIRYSDEGEHVLETGGGVLKALDLLGAGPFLVINGDIWTDFAFGPLSLAENDLAHLVLVPNPEHNPDGDFALRAGRVLPQGEPKLTFSGIGVYREELFAGREPGAFPLAPLLRAAAAQGRVSGERYDGVWSDVGTPERLETLRREQAGRD